MGSEWTSNPGIFSDVKSVEAGEQQETDQVMTEIQRTSSMEVEEEKLVKMLHYSEREMKCYMLWNIVLFHHTHHADFFVCFVFPLRLC